jgi:hypothetical protein
MLYILLDACNWLTSKLLAYPIINVDSVGEQHNQICYLQQHCHVLLGWPVDGNNDCWKV